MRRLFVPSWGPSDWRRLLADPAKQWVRAAEHLERLPCLAEGLASGALSLDLVAPLAEVASPETDATLREASVHWSVRQAQELVAWHRAEREVLAARLLGQLDDEEDHERRSGSLAMDASAREFEHRTLRFNDTRRSVWVAFTRDDYAAAKSALVGRVKADKSAAEEDRPFGLAISSGTVVAEYVPYDKRLYDALMGLFRWRSVSSAGAGSSAPRPFRPRLVVHAPLDGLVGAASQEMAELAGVGPISSEVVRRLACDAEVILSAEDRNGSIMDQGRARRDPTAAQRVEIERRDKRCRFPGCEYTEFTDIHHVRHWVDGGETSLYNLVTLCDRHHRAVHELGWAVEGDANAVLHFTGPHGRVVTSAPSPTWHHSSAVGVRPSPSADPPLRC